MTSQPPLEPVSSTHEAPLPPLADRFIELARQIAGRGDFTPKMAFSQALRLAIDLTPGVRWATFICRSSVRDQPFASSSISTVGDALDRLQCTHGEGPSLDALASSAVVVAGDLTKEYRWPGFTASATAMTPARTALSYPLALTGRPDIALNLYGDDPGTLTGQQPEALNAASCIGFVIAAIDARQRADSLAQAMVSNREIGAAVGILMARHDWTPDRAFAAIRRASQRQHRKVREIADAILKTGELPGDPADPADPVSLGDRVDPRDLGPVT